MAGVNQRSHGHGIGEQCVAAFDHRVLGREWRMRPVVVERERNEPPLGESSGRFG